MKSFIACNWYRILIGSSSIIFSLAFMVFALKTNTLQAETSPTKVDNTNNQVQSNVYIVGAGAHIYEVRYDRTMEKYKIKQIDIKN